MPSKSGLSMQVSTEEIARLREVAQDRTIESAIDAVREMLGMEVAYATEITATEQRFLTLSGDAGSFGLAAGAAMPIDETYCKRILSGRLPNIIPDVRGEDRAASLAVTEEADVGAFVGVPLRFSDGRLFGTLCAASHERKPELGYRELQFLHVFARIVADDFERRELEQQASRLDRQLTATSALMAAIEARDAYTAEHSHAVVRMARAVAERLGLEGEQVEEVGQVAMLHDIGKIRIPDAILGKPGPLDDAEWEEMRRHPIYGEELIMRTPGLSELAPAMRAEHERWDGSGYPDGLAGTAIPIASRIVLACDAYHAMISDRPYRAAMSRSEALEELRGGSGSQFDPRVVEALIELIEARAAEDADRRAVADDPSPVPGRLQCARCGAHVTAKIGRATVAGVCGNCGSYELEALA